MKSFTLSYLSWKKGVNKKSNSQQGKVIKKNIFTIQEMFRHSDPKSAFVELCNFLTILVSYNSCKIALKDITSINHFQDFTSSRMDYSRFMWLENSFEFWNISLWSKFKFSFHVIFLWLEFNADYRLKIK